MRNHFWRFYFVQRAKSPCENPIFGSGSKLLSDQVLMEVYFHSHKDLKFASQIRMPCEFHGVAKFHGKITISQGLRNFGARSNFAEQRKISHTLRIHYAKFSHTMRKFQSLLKLPSDGVLLEICCISHTLRNFARLAKMSCVPTP